MDSKNSLKVELIMNTGYDFHYDLKQKLYCFVNDIHLNTNDELHDYLSFLLYDDIDNEIINLSYISKSEINGK